MLYKCTTEYARKSLSDEASQVIHHHILDMSVERDSVLYTVSSWDDVA